MDEMFLFAIFGLFWFYGTRILISLAVTIPIIYLVIYYLNRTGRHIMVRARWIILAGILVGIVFGWISWECL